MGVVPMVNVLPGAGPEVRTMETPVQLSKAVGTVQLTTELFVNPFTLMLPGQPEMTGASVSNGMTFTVLLVAAGQAPLVTFTLTDVAWVTPMRVSTVRLEKLFVHVVPPFVLVCHTMDPLMGPAREKGTSEPGQNVPPPVRMPTTETGLTVTVIVVL